VNEKEIFKWQHIKYVLLFASACGVYDLYIDFKQQTALIHTTHHTALIYMTVLYGLIIYLTHTHTQVVSIVEF